MARRKLSLLQLGQELGNVAKACRNRRVMPPALLRDPPQLPGPWRRGVARPAAGSKGTAPQPRRAADREGDPGPCAQASHPRGQACGRRAVAHRAPGQFGRSAGRVDPQRPQDPPRVTAPAGGEGPQAPHRSPLSQGRTCGRGHLLRGHAQGRRQGPYRLPSHHPQLFSVRYRHPMSRRRAARLLPPAYSQRPHEARRRAWRASQPCWSTSPSTRSGSGVAPL